MSNLYSVANIRMLERMAIEQYGISESQLMQAAGLAAFDTLRARMPSAQRIVVLCGRGNNGGDGWVVARLAHEAGLNVTVYHVGALAADQAVVQDAQAAGVHIEPFVDGVDLAGGAAKVDVIVDALLGIGVSGEVRGDMVAAIRAMKLASKQKGAEGGLGTITPKKSGVELARCRILAIDCPSGIDADTGAILGVAARADITVTFIGIKQGLMTGAAPGFVGEVVCDDLGLPPQAFAHVAPSAQLIEPVHLPARKREAHKGRYGHVLVIGGDCGMPGAVRMAAEAAARVGAGLVSVATRPEHASTLNTTRPELMVHGVRKAEEVLHLLEQATVLVIGPGLGQRDWGKDLLQVVLGADQPKVIDADGLNLLVGLPTRSDDWVLTPHPGEAARLLGWQEGERAHTPGREKVHDHAHLQGSVRVQADRFAAIQQLHAHFGGVCVLKGAGTLVVTPGGELFVCEKGNPGMASGGMGDVLSGVIAGLIAQRLSLEEAAKTGVYIHATAADRAAAEGGERGLLAMDVVNQLRAVVNGLHRSVE